MLRINWPLAILLAIVLLAIGRNPRLLEPIVIVFVVWFVWQQVKRNKR
jgi:hypothetical protein